MAFQKIDVQESSNADDTGVRVALVKLGKGAARLRITVDERIKSRFFIADTHGRELHVGTGEHHGLIRLVPCSGEYLRAQRRFIGGGKNARQVHVFNCGHLPHFVDRAEKPQSVQWSVLDAGIIEIALPKWADETKPRPKSAEDLQRDMNRDAAARRKRMGM